MNVGGSKHEISWSKLEKMPNSRLCKIRFAKSIDELEQLCDGVNLLKNELFFDRPANNFISIINLYQTGKLHLLNEVCILSFHDELVYWGVDEYYFETCCHLKYYQRKEVITEEIKRTEHVLKEEEQFGTCCVGLRKKMWNLMEYPDTSLLAKVNHSVLNKFNLTIARNCIILMKLFSITISNSIIDLVSYF